MFTRSFISLVPSSALISQSIVLRRVVFPEPFFQIIPILSFFRTSIYSGRVTRGKLYPTSIFLSFIITSGSLILLCICMNFHTASFSGFLSISILSSALIRLCTLEALAEFARNLLIYASVVSISFC